MIAEVIYDGVIQEEGRTQLIVQMKGDKVVGYMIKLCGVLVEIADNVEEARKAFQRTRIVDVSTAGK